jgi:hypothetical protein
MSTRWRPDASNVHPAARVIKFASCHPATSFPCLRCTSALLQGTGASSVVDDGTFLRHYHVVAGCRHTPVAGVPETCLEDCPHGLSKVLPTCLWLLRVLVAQIPPVFAQCAAPHSTRFLPTAVMAMQQKPEHIYKVHPHSAIQFDGLMQGATPRQALIRFESEVWGTLAWSDQLV